MQRGFFKAALKKEGGCAAAAAAAAAWRHDLYGVTLSHHRGPSLVCRQVTLNLANQRRNQREHPRFAAHFAHALHRVYLTRSFLQFSSQQAGEPRAGAAAQVCQPTARRKTHVRACVCVRVCEKCKAAGPSSQPWLLFRQTLFLMVRRRSLFGRRARKKRELLLCVIMILSVYPLRYFTPLAHSLNAAAKDTDYSKNCQIILVTPRCNNSNKKKIVVTYLFFMNWQIILSATQLFVERKTH
jgi:hypothetical protein